MTSNHQHESASQKYPRLLFCLISAAILGVFAATAQIRVAAPRRLSPEARISLITKVPGSTFWSAFGHSALRIQDPSQDMDMIFNHALLPHYDIFSAQIFSPLRSNLDIYQGTRHLAKEESQGRKIFVQQLNLTHRQSQKIYQELLSDSTLKPLYFHVHPYYNNCSSTIHSIFKAVLPELQGDEIPFEKIGTELITFRKESNSYLDPFPWTKLCTNLSMSANIDRAISSSDLLFTPKYLSIAANKMKILGPNGMHSLVKSGSQAFEHTQKATSPPINTVKWSFSALFFIILYISWRNWKKRTEPVYWIDAALLSFAGILSILIYHYLWYAARPVESMWNYHLLWAWPMHLLLIPVGLSYRWRKHFFPIYIKAQGAVLLGLLIIWWLIPAAVYIPAPIIPFLISILIRSTCYSSTARKLLTDVG